MVIQAMGISRGGVQKHLPSHFAKMLRPKHGWLTFVLDQAWQHLQLREMDTTTLGGLAQKATESSFSSSFFSTFALT